MIYNFIETKMEIKNILTTIVILSIVLGIIINYNSRENIFGTNLISIGIVAFIGISVYNHSENKT